MDAPLRWYQKEEISSNELERLMKEGEFRKIDEIYPGPEQSKHIQEGDKIAVLMNNGLVGHYTITVLIDGNGCYIVGRDETGIQEKGTEFSLDSGMGWCRDFGYKVLEKFPWE